MIKQLTAKEVVKKYKNKYIGVNKLPYDNGKDVQLYEVFKSYSTIHENTCLVVNENFYEDWLN